MRETSKQVPSNYEARESILESIRQSLDESIPFNESWRKHHGYSGADVDRKPRVRPDYSQHQLIDNFRENLESVGGHFYMVQNFAETREVVKGIIERTNARRIAVSNSELVTKIISSLPEVEYIEMASPAALFECDLGITSAQWAIAETGTIVLESDHERHRLNSLVPPVHLCVLKAERIRQSLGEVLVATQPDLSRTMTFVTGASRTLDIELTLAIGVHGPEQLYVVVIAE